jgi:Na+-driven multidrug efflux pump
MESGKKAHLKEKAAEEVRLLLLITAYLAAFFVAFLTYRRLISREFGVSSFRYGFALIEALIIAKVILIGKALGVGKRAGARTLAVSVLRSSLIYGGLVAVFAVLEHVIEALVHGKTFAVGVEDLLNQGIYEIGGRVLVLFVAFIPFFAFWELGSLTGETKLFDYFFKKGAARKSA